MIYKIHKGKHRAWPPRLGIFRNRTEFNYDVVFHNDCRYFIEDGDQEDTNKLFGFSYFFSDHVDSARFGWRYDLEKDKIEILAYCYINGNRSIDSLGFFDFETQYQASIWIIGNSYDLNFMGQDIAIPFTHKKKWQYPLGVYFGGNKTAPRTMTITLSKH